MFYSVIVGGFITNPQSLDLRNRPGTVTKMLSDLVWKRSIYFLGLLFFMFILNSHKLSSVVCFFEILVQN